MKGRAVGTRAASREAGTEERTVDRLDRRIKRLEKRFDRVAEAARKREEDFGTVRSKAEQVPKLREEVRELKRQIAQLERQIGRGTRREEPPTHALEAPAGPAVRQRAIPVASEGVFDRFAGELPSEDELRGMIRTEIQSAFRGQDVGDLVSKVRPDLGAKLEKFTPVLRKFGIELDVDDLLITLSEYILDRVDFDEFLDKVLSQSRSGARRQRRR